MEQEQKLKEFTLNLILQGKINIFLQFTSFKELNFFVTLFRAGSYNIEPYKLKYFYKYSFGGKIDPIPLVTVVCKPQQLDKCSKCDEAPCIDYWKNFEEEIVLCRYCMEKEVNDARYNSKSKAIKVQRLEDLNNKFKVSTSLLNLTNVNQFLTLVYLCISAHKILWLLP